MSVRLLLKQLKLLKIQLQCKWKKPERHGGCKSASATKVYVEDFKARTQ